METVYLVFAGDVYYPAGGASDFQGVFTTEEDAQACCDALVGTYDWSDILIVEAGPGHANAYRL